MNPAVMIVEDEPELAALVADYARAAGYEPQVFGDGAQALEAIRIQAPALVVLDLMLPGLDGLSVCRAVRASSEVPIVMVTARVEEIDRLLGLEAGADDYLCKPFSPRELMARIKAILRRAAPEAPPARYYRFVGFTLDLKERTVVDHAGNPVALTGLDFQLLKYFTEHPGQILDRGLLCEQTRGRDAGPLDRSLDVQISRLRLRLNDDGKQPALIKTVRGAGYVFSAAVSVSSV